jgi:hypothetical protein
MLLAYPLHATAPRHRRFLGAGLLATSVSGFSTATQPRDWERVMVDAGGKITEPAVVVGRLVDDRGIAIEYRDHGEAARTTKVARRDRLP